MKNKTYERYYTPEEEKVNIVSHAFGFIMSVIALVLLITYASIQGNIWQTVSFSVFGTSMVFLYASSTLYHSSKNPRWRSIMHVVDHASIFILIAGSYTPYTLVTLKGTLGWVVFGMVWGIALAGIILKIFFTGKYDLISTLIYLAMGWAVVLVIKPVIANLPFSGFLWLLAGGIFYTIGAVLYSTTKIKFNHAIFHIAVLLGSFCHFISVFFYVI